MLPRLDPRLFHATLATESESESSTGAGAVAEARSEVATVDSGPLALGSAMRAAAWESIPQYGITGGTGPVARLSLPPLLDWRRQWAANGGLKGKMKRGRSVGGIGNSGPEVEAGSAAAAPEEVAPWGNAQSPELKAYCRSFFGPGYASRAVFLRSDGAVRLLGPEVATELAHRPTRGALGAAAPDSESGRSRDGAAHLDDRPSGGTGSAS